MEQQTPRIHYLLDQYLRNEATEQEREELMLLLREGGQDMEVKDHIIYTLQQTEVSEELRELRANEMLQWIFEQKPKAKVVSLWKRRLLPFAAASVLLIAASFLGWQFFRINKEAVPAPMAAEKPKEASAPSFIRLPDGSTVLLTEGSKLLYPTSFEGKERNVTLIGEGYFDIKEDREKPFVIESAGVRTRVLGTAFNIRAYPGETNVVVTVDQGSVQVHPEQGKAVILKRSEQVAINTRSRQMEQKVVNVDQVLAWQKSVVVLDDITLKEAADILEKQYQVHLIFANDRITTCRIQASFFHGEDLKEVLEVISGVLNLSWKPGKGNSIVLDGTGC